MTLIAGSPDSAVCGCGDVPLRRRILAATHLYPSSGWQRRRADTLRALARLDERIAADLATIDGRRQRLVYFGT